MATFLSIFKVPLSDEYSDEYLHNMFKYKIVTCKWLTEK